ncbi:MAG: class I SAM-dependent methyltransferase [Sedimenticolaceae bacterium]
MPRWPPHDGSATWCPASASRAAGPVPARAQAEGLAIDYQLADAEALPFADTSFDHVVSTFGVMSRPTSHAAAELRRVRRLGGSIGPRQLDLGWLRWPTAQDGRAPRATPAGVSSPTLWGTDAFLTEQYAGKASRGSTSTGSSSCFVIAPEHFLQVFRDYYGPVHKAFSVLDDAQQDALSRDIQSLIAEFNRADMAA